MNDIINGFTLLWIHLEAFLTPQSHLILVAVLTFTAALIRLYYKMGAKKIFCLSLDIQYITQIKKKTFIRMLISWELCLLLHVGYSLNMSMWWLVRLCPNGATDAQWKLLQILLKTTFIFSFIHLDKILYLLSLLVIYHYCTWGPPLLWHWFVDNAMSVQLKIVNKPTLNLS